MSQSTIQDEIRELNLAYLMLAQHMLREDRESAMLRLGINAGYMKFSKKQKWVPF